MLTRLVTYAIPALVLVWTAHVVLTWLGDPFGVVFDVGLWLVASLLRFAALLSVVEVVDRIHRHAYRNRPRALGAFAVWTAAGLALLFAMAATRGWWAPVLRTDAVVYFSPSARAPGGAELFRQPWLDDWDSGLVTALEAGLLIVISAMHALCAYFFGARPFRSAFIASVAALMLMGTYLAWCPWFSLDYDNFHGDLLIGALVFDQVMLLASDPYTTIAGVYYLAMWVACLSYLRVMRTNRILPDSGSQRR